LCSQKKGLVFYVVNPPSCMFSCVKRDTHVRPARATKTNAAPHTECFIKDKVCKKEGQNLKDHILTQYPRDLAAFAHFAEFTKFDLA
jgi:hypothetical protein